MIQITPQLRILVAIEAIDGRKGIDSLAQLCREKLDADPFSGCLIIFRSRSAKAMRILAYDRQGFRLATKRLSKGRFRWWPTGLKATKTLRAQQAQMLLGDLDKFSSQTYLDELAPNYSKSVLTKVRVYLNSILDKAVELESGGGP
jgi:hypothetical protein